VDEATPYDVVYRQQGIKEPIAVLPNAPIPVQGSHVALHTQEFPDFKCSTLRVSRVTHSITRHGRCKVFHFTLTVYVDGYLEKEEAHDPEEPTTED
jgi:hypothetical protein